MSIKAMEMALEALEVRCGTNADERKPGGVIESLRAALQQAESEPVAYVCPTSHHARDGSMEDGPDYLEWADEASDYEKRVGTPLYTHPAPGVPDGWRIEEKGSDIIVRKYGFGGYSARKNTESIAEAVLHELALDLLAASPAQKG